MTILGLRARRADVLRVLVMRHRKKLANASKPWSEEKARELFDSANLMMYVTAGTCDDLLRMLPEPPAPREDVERMADRIERKWLTRPGQMATADLDPRTVEV